MSVIIDGTSGITTPGETNTGSLSVAGNSTLAGLTQSVISTNTDAVVGTYYTLTASLTLTLPASPTAGQVVSFSNLSGTTTCVIGRNGNKIMALSEDLTLDSAQARGALIYTGATNGWVLFNN